MPKTPKQLGYEEVKRKVTLLGDVADIEPYHFELPEPPPVELIENYGLPKEEQFFQREKIPRKVWEITKAVNSDKITRDAAVLMVKQDTELVAFIQDQWAKRENGIWIYIHGKPEYITGQ